MNCSCPKCSAPVEFEPAEISENGLNAACPACKAKLVISSEDFSRRLYRRAHTISCSKCGESLGAEAFCSSCGEPYPDYFVAEDPSSRKKRINALKRNDIKLTGFSFEFKFRGKAESSKALSAEGLTQYSESISEKKPKSDKAEPVSSSRSKLVKILVSLLIAAVAVYGAYLYYDLVKKENEFVKQSLKVLYKVKAGKDMGASACQKMIAASASSPLVRITSEDEAKIRKVSSEIASSVSSLSAPSGKYESTATNIKKLAQLSERYRTLALTPPANVSELKDSSAKLESEFVQGIAAFKRDMPEKVSKALVDAKKVYKPLNDF